MDWGSQGGERPVSCQLCGIYIVMVTVLFFIQYLLVFKFFLSPIFLAVSEIHAYYL